MSPRETARRAAPGSRFGGALKRLNFVPIGTKPRSQIFKVQRSIVGTNGETWLFYNQSGSITVELAGEKIGAEVRALMGNRFKMYVHGHMVPDGGTAGGHLISIDGQAPWQDW